MSRTFWTARSAFGRVAMRTKRCRPSVSGIMGQGGRWVLEVDVRKYFDSIDHAKLREFLARRVTDGVVRRLIDKWLKAGVLEAGQVSLPRSRYAAGWGDLARCLSNVFLALRAR